MVGCAALAALLLLPPDEPLRRELRGRVVDERRFPVVGATVVSRSRNEDGSIAESPPATSGTGGVFAIAGELARTEWGGATCDLIVRAAGGLAAWECVSFGSYDLDAGGSLELRRPLLARPAVEWRVEVVDRSGPVPDANVELFGAFGSIPLATVRSDESGRVAISGVADVECHLVARHATRGRSTVGRARAGRPTGNTRVELLPTRTVEVEVVDVDRATPVVGARVLVWLLREANTDKGRERHLREWPLTAAEATTDASGRVTLRDLPGDLPLEIDAAATGWAARWSVPSDCIPEPSYQAAVELARDATSARLAMKALVPKEVRWPLEEGRFAPPDGTPIELRPRRTARWSDPLDRPLQRAAVVRGRAVVATCGVVAGIEGGDPRADYAAREWIALAPDGAIALLTYGPEEAPFLLRFEPTASLDVTLRKADGAPLVGELITVSRERSARDDRGHDTDLRETDARGVARFEELRAGRWELVCAFASRTIALESAARAVVLQRVVDPAVTEVRFEFQIDGQRRLPADCDVSFGSVFDHERFRDRVELPERGELRCFLERRSGMGERFAMVALPNGTRRVELPPLPAPGAKAEPLVVPVDLSDRARGAVEVRVRGRDPARAFVSLEQVARLDGAVGRDHHHAGGRAVGPDVAVCEFRDVEPGMWRAIAHFGAVASAPFQVAAGAEPVAIELDASQFVEVAVQWKVPAGESPRCAELVAHVRGLAAPDSWLDDGEWRFAEPGPTTTRFTFDRAHPRPLVIRHPYLRSSRWNDAIDLTNPRSTLTLHLELGPMLEFAPRFEGEPTAEQSQLSVASVRVAPLAADGAATTSSDERRVALRRGATFATAPLPAGSWRVLIDPRIAAPAEIERLESDGGARDLGPLAFARGSTLRVRVVAPEGFAVPRVAARAERIDGMRYERWSAPQPLSASPVDPEIRALGAGRFRIVVTPMSGGDLEWTTTAVVDGVHDAEVTIVAE